MKHPGGRGLLVVPLPQIPVLAPMFSQVYSSTKASWSLRTWQVVFPSYSWGVRRSSVLSRTRLTRGWRKSEPCICGPIATLSTLQGLSTPQLSPCLTQPPVLSKAKIRGPALQGSAVGVNTHTHKNLLGKLKEGNPVEQKTVCGSAPDGRHRTAAQTWTPGRGSCVKKGVGRGSVLTPPRGIQAPRLGYSQRYHPWMQTDNPVGTEQARGREGWTRFMVHQAGWQLQDVKASVQGFGVEWRSAVTCGDLRPPPQPNPQRPGLPRGSGLKCLEGVRRLG